MSWIWAVVLAGLALVVILLLLRWQGQPRAGWEAIAAALLLGIAGYGLQGRPGLAGAPKQPVERTADDSQALVAARKAIDGKPAAPGSNWVVTAEAFARRGQYADAVGLLQLAVEKNPRDFDAWLAMADGLVRHADGTLSPAALLAFRKAAELEPQHPGPPLLLGLAMAQSGRFEEARAIWTELLAKTPADAPWRADLTNNLNRLGMIIARQNAMQGMPMGQPGTMP